jgi:hypothetical protein
VLVEELDPVEGVVDDPDDVWLGVDDVVVVLSVFVTEV